jgi:hypothetical protein
MRIINLQAWKDSRSRSAQGLCAHCFTCDFVEGNYPTLAGWWQVLRGISIYVIADAGMVAQSVLKQFDRIVWRFSLDDSNARIVVVGGNAGVFNGVSFHGVSVCYTVPDVFHSVFTNVL